MPEETTASGSSSTATSRAAAAATSAAAAGDTTAAALACINPVCARILEPDSRFCPYCATDQLQQWASGTSGSGGSASAKDGTPESSAPFAFSAGQHASSNASFSAHDSTTRMSGSNDGDDRAIVMRAGDAIWHFEEVESPVPPGAKRALLIVDEQTVHLARTDRRIAPEELLRRVQALLIAQKAPVDARLLQTRWQNDTQEQRPRIVASLTAPHPYSDVKAVLGVDYLGAWASVHINLGVEPEPLPLPPPRPKYPLLDLLGPLIMFGLCALLGVYAVSTGQSNQVDSSTLVVLGAAALGALGSISWFVRAVTGGFVKLQLWQLEWEAEQRRKQEEKLRERLSRTFKVDDARLFASAMREVFQQVVDDIVTQSPSAEVVRIEGGQGGFFTGSNSTEGVASLTDSAPRRSDAAMAAV